ncbi:MAG TPA: hypothetical protein ENI87_15280 [bacterium]|nr:hypothetical protein [bacterium]
MVAPSLSQTELRNLLESVAGTIDETLSSLVGKDIKVTCKDVTAPMPAELLADLKGNCAVARGAMDKDYADRSMLALFEMPDAIAMAGLLMMTPEDVVAKRREGSELEGEDVEAFGELGNVLFSGFSNVLREKIQNCDVRMHDHGKVEPNKDEDGLLGDARLVVCSFEMKVGDYPPSTGRIAIDFETAEKWNGGPIELSEDAGGSPPAPDDAALAHGDDDGLTTIPKAPIRGTLAAFLVLGDVYRLLRRSCRRVGLELNRHGRGEIPNPAAHRHQIVLMDVPPGEDRRFDWCRRLKELSETTKVVVLIHHPSRQRVTQAFLSKADAILGYPCEEQHLSQKLEALVADLGPASEPAPTPAAEPTSGDTAPEDKDEDN